MDKTFSYQSQIKDIQNNLLTQNIRDNSNLTQLNSEEAIRNVLVSYIDRFKELGNSLIDINKFIVKSKDLIKVKDFNDFFEGVYIDLYSLYTDIGSVATVLETNLQRNKNYLLVIKKRIRDLWNRLNLVRSYIYDENPADESFYESFSTNVNSSYNKNCNIDKKNGYLFLDPIRSTIQNKSVQIKSITTQILPEPNDNGGVFKTTNVLNTYEENYINGPRDMLQNGLWKEEILTNEVPSMLVNIGTNDKKMLRNYRGVVGIIDIEYTSPIEFNRIDFDIFGDKPLLIDAILYKDFLEDNWKVVNFLPEDNLSEIVNNENQLTYPARGEGFDIVTFYNIDKIKTKYLRIVVNQENYIILSKSAKSIISLEEKITQDFSERRYEVLKFDNSLDGLLTSPVNSENRSLYDKIMDIIESTSSIEKILEGIKDLLLPTVEITKVGFTNTYKFEMGLWSIEPTLELYNYSKAIYHSNEIELKDRSLISVSLNSKQQIPQSSTCNWYININDKAIPIVENSSSFRKEPINYIDMSRFSTFKNWSNGCFIRLDFPVDALLSQQIKIYENGIINENIGRQILFLNSSLIFIYGLKNPLYNNYVIRYNCSLYDVVNLYALVPKVVINDDNNLLQLGIVSSNKEILEAFINNVTYSNSTKKISEDYSITNILATKKESIFWFNNKFEKCISISTSVINKINTISNEYLRFSSIIFLTQSKLSTSIQNVNNFNQEINLNGLNDFSILGSLSNIIPFSNVRTI